MLPSTRARGPRHLLKTRVTPSGTARLLGTRREHIQRRRAMSTIESRIAARTWVPGAPFDQPDMAAVAAGGQYAASLRMPSAILAGLTMNHSSRTWL